MLILPLLLWACSSGNKTPNFWHAGDSNETGRDSKADTLNDSGHDTGKAGNGYIIDVPYGQWPNVGRDAQATNSIQLDGFDYANLQKFTLVNEASPSMAFAPTVSVEDGLVRLFIGGEYGASLFTNGGLTGMYMDDGTIIPSPFFNLSAGRGLIGAKNASGPIVEFEIDATGQIVPVWRQEVGGTVFGRGITFDYVDAEGVPHNYMAMGIDSGELYLFDATKDSESEALIWLGHVMGSAYGGVAANEEAICVGGRLSSGTDPAGLFCFAMEDSNGDKQGDLLGQWPLPENTSTYASPAIDPNGNHYVYFGYNCDTTPEVTACEYGTKGGLVVATTPDLSEVCRYELDGHVRGGVAVGDGAVYFQNALTGEVIAMDKNDCSHVLWQQKYTGSDTASADATPVYVKTDAANYLLVNVEEQTAGEAIGDYILILNADNGEQLMQYKLSEMTGWFPDSGKCGPTISIGQNYADPFAEKVCVYTLKDRGVYALCEQ
ncbi:MAG: hypothetical protein WC890_06720 [Candidatus Margulisiibacteriota bacterium]